MNIVNVNVLSLMYNIYANPFNLDSDLLASFFTDTDITNKQFILTLWTNIHVNSQVLINSIKNIAPSETVISWCKYFINKLLEINPYPFTNEEIEIFECYILASLIMQYDMDKWVDDSVLGVLQHALSIATTSQTDSWYCQYFIRIAYIRYLTLKITPSNSQEYLNLIRPELSLAARDEELVRNYIIQSV